MEKGWGEGQLGSLGGSHPYLDVTESIIGAAIRVQRSLGPGLLEDAYKVCLAHALRLDGHLAMQEVHLDISYEGLCIPNAYRMDIVVDSRVVVEIKTVDRFTDAHFAQVNSYLRFSGLEVGILLNFRGLATEGRRHQADHQLPHLTIFLRDPPLFSAPQR